MQIENLKSQKGQIIEGPLLIKPNLFKDNRGFFQESWNKKIFNDAIKSNIEFVQDNHSKSYKGVLRGLHYQLPEKAQTKLIRCTYGSIFDVIVDIRKSSSTFGDWTYSELTSDNKNQIWVPEGFAHGFLVLSDYAEVQYKTDNYWHKESERSIRWDDKKININWPLKDISIDSPIMGGKDIEAPSFEQAILLGDIF